MKANLKPFLIACSIIISFFCLAWCAQFNYIPTRNDNHGNNNIRQCRHCTKKNLRNYNARPHRDNNFLSPTHKKNKQDEEDLYELYMFGFFDKSKSK